jgi:hypothetical protein
MRREALFLLAVSALMFAAVDQTYIHDFSRDGSSKITKTSELSIFSAELTNASFANMKAVCDDGFRVDCSVDVAKKTVTITESFAPGGYYTFGSVYGLPDITHTLVIEKIPNDKFASALSKLLIAANVTDPSQGGGSVSPIDFEDELNNREAAAILRMIRANLTYTINMPYDIDEAVAGNVTGNVSGKSVSFDLISLLEQSKPLMIRSRELNLGYIVLIFGILVIAALAFSFFWSKPMKTMKKKKG